MAKWRAPSRPIRLEAAASRPRASRRRGGLPITPPRAPRRERHGEGASAFKANPTGSGGVKPESIETSAGLAYYTAESAKDGATNVRRYSMILPGGTFSGYVAVQVPENATKIYSDDAIRQMFASAVIRKEVPIEEQLGLMPFKVGELSDFKNVRTLAPNAAIILADGDEVTGFEAAP